MFISTWVQLLLLFVYIIRHIVKSEYEQSNRKKLFVIVIISHFF